MLVSNTWPAQLAAQRKKENQKEKNTETKNSASAAVPENEKIADAFIEGAIKFAQLNPREAGTHFQQVLKIDPNNSAAAYFLARILTDEKNYADALPLINNALQLTQSNIWFYLLKAEIVEAMGKPKEAITTLETALAIFKNDVHLLSQLIDKNLAINDYEKALKWLEILERLSSYDEEVITKKPLIYMKMNQPEKAIQAIEQLITQNPQEIRYQHLLFEILVQLGRTNDAIEAIKKILITHPDDPIAVFRLIEYYEQQQQISAAAAMRRKAFASEKIPADAKLQYLSNLLAGAEKEPAKYDTALFYVNSMTNTQHSSALAYGMKADIFSSRKQEDSARYYYKKSVSINELNPKIWEQLLFKDLALQLYDSLLEDSETALEIYPDNVIINYLNGLANYQQNKYRKAITVLTRAIKFGVSEKELLQQIYTLLGDCYHFENENTKSNEAFDKALSIIPDHPQTLNNYAHCLALRKEALDKALKMSSLALKSKPNESHYLATYGLILLQQGKYQAALETLEKAYAINATAEICELVGDAHARLGNIEKALTYWKEAKEKGSKSQTINKKISTKSIE